MIPLDIRLNGAYKKTIQIPQNACKRHVEFMAYKSIQNDFPDITLPEKFLHQLSFRKSKNRIIDIVLPQPI